MLAARVQPYLQNLASQRKWSDQEVKDDIEFLIDELKGAKQRMSCVDPRISSTSLELRPSTGRTMSIPVS